jgi:hypothetical protein
VLVRRGGRTRGWALHKQQVYARKLAGSAV